MAKKKFKGLARQDAFVKSVAGEDFDFGLVFTQAFLKGIRDIGYRSTATALFENIDNAIQAEAENIHVHFDFNGKTRTGQPDRIAIVDDGHGMSREMMRIAVLWGGSDRLDDREGMGKYGYGLPSSCVSIGQRFTVISKREDMTEWSGVTIDIQDIMDRKPEYIDAKTGRIVAPPAKTAVLPQFLENFYGGNTKTHGTIILIEKIDRVSKKSFTALKKLLSLETGITYRNYLRQLNLFIDGELVEAVDPLFITEGFKFYDENDLRAVKQPSLAIEVDNSEAKGRKGNIKVRYSYMPYGFMDGKPAESDQPELPLEKEEEEDKDFDDGGKKSKSKRLTVRKHNNGIIFLRNGRQIDVVESKCPWTKFQTNDRYIGIEVDFSPELDEEFSITTSKQQIVPSERIWNILRDNGVYEVIATLRAKYKKEAGAEKNRKQNARAATPQKADEFVEDLMKQSARDFETSHEGESHQLQQEGAENLNKQVKQIAEQTGMPEVVVKENLQKVTESKPYKLGYFDEPDGPFYRPEQVGGQVVIWINREHRFYTDLFNNNSTNAFLKNALALIVFVIGHSELRVTDEKRKWYKIERLVWSMKLESALETLSKYFTAETEEEVFEEESSDSVK